MVSDYRCFFCFARAFERLLNKEQLTQQQANQFTHEMINLYSRNQHVSSTPQFAQKLHASYKKYTGNADPYKMEKKQSNELVLKMYEKLKKQIKTATNPFDTALRLAIAGNIIDFAVNDQFDLDGTINNVLNSDFSIDHSLQLKDELNKAKTVLYLGDNNGEIVFDKLFIKTIDHSNLIYAVRGAPVINDVTLEDAHDVGMTKIVPVISNGDDAPSTILEHCSDEFMTIFNQADVIISKGQGNLEGLLNKSDHNIFFLLMVKCDVIAETLHVKKGDFVVKKNNQNK